MRFLFRLAFWLGIVFYNLPAASPHSEATKAKSGIRPSKVESPGPAGVPIGHSEQSSSQATVRPELQNRRRGR